MTKYERSKLRQFADAVTAEQVPDYTDLSIQDSAVIKYLKCETIELAEEAEPKAGAERTGGMTLVGTEGFPLGWGKKNGNVIKNKYFSGWRMM